jgi:mitochondrial fission protein ELM1
LEAAGIVRYFNGKNENWNYEPLNETTRIATIIKNRLKTENII